MMKRLSYLLSLLFAIAFTSSGKLHAEEPASQFLQELRNQRYFELAEYYLDVQVDKNLLSDEFRAKIDLERAMVILSGARSVANGAERDKKFAEAQTLLERFSAAVENTDLKIQSNNELGNLLFQRAKLVEFESAKELDQEFQKTLGGYLAARATRLLAARVDEIEVKFAFKTPGGVIPVRGVATSAEGPWLSLRTYIERVDPVTGVTLSYCDVEGNNCVVEPYPAADAVSKKRATARRIGPT